MCKQHNPRVIDKCMRQFVECLDYYIALREVRIVASCCGHGKYPMTILIKGKPNNGLFRNPFAKDAKDIVQDLVSGLIIPRKKRFYVKDKEGYYYIPEVVGGRKR